METESQQARVTEDHAAPWDVERTLALARWGAAVFACLQAWLYQPPSGSRPYLTAATWALGGALVATNLALLPAIRRRDVTRRLAALVYGVDITVVCGIVWLYLSNPDATQWVLFMILQLEGAYRYEMRGAVGTAIGTSVFYAVARTAAARQFSFDLTVDSITYVLGLTLVQALVVGGMAQRLRAERDASDQLNEAALTLNAGLDRDEILAGVVTEAARITDASIAVVWVPHPDGFQPAASHGLPPDFDEAATLLGSDPVFGMSSVGEAFASKRTVALPDPGAPRDSRPVLESALLPVRWQSAVSVPILQDDEPLGVLSCYMTRSVGTRPGVVGRLQALGSIAAIAVSNAQALDRERGALEAMRALDNLKDDFLSTVSHELRTPLTVVEGFATTLLNRWDELGDDMRIDLVRRIERQASELHERIRDLLDFSRLQSGALDLRPAPFDLAGFVRETVHRLEPSTRPHEVRVDVPGPVPCYSDRSAVSQILENLIVNAARYSAPDTTITVHAAVDDGWAELSVADDGIGIPSDQQERIFERFYRGPQDEVRRIRGTGIGLAIVKELTEALGGRVRVDSRVGEGSTFVVRLPATEATAPGSMDALGSIASPPTVQTRG